jgi:spermidine synthase
MLDYSEPNSYYLETLYPDWRQAMKVDEVIYEEKTAHQDLLIFENTRFGRVLALDGVIQTTYKDAKIYSEMMVHVPAMAHGNVKSVLIIGGGDGSVLKEALRYKSVESVVVVEIDPSVVETTKKWMPEICKDAFLDPKAKVVIQDAAEYVKNTSERFDLIICDSTDPFGPAAPLFTKEFYYNCKKCLKEKGIFVNQNGVPFLQKEEMDLTKENRAPYFNFTTYYVVAMPTYVGGHMILGWASDEKEYLDLSLETLSKRALEIEGDFIYYTPKVHQAAFALPAFMLK